VRIGKYCREANKRTEEKLGADLHQSFLDLCRLAERKKGEQDRGERKGK
jgi:hypothetical protein